MKNGLQRAAGRAARVCPSAKVLFPLFSFILILTNCFAFDTSVAVLTSVNIIEFKRVSVSHAIITHVPSLEVWYRGEHGLSLGHRKVLEYIVGTCVTSLCAAL